MIQTPFSFLLLLLLLFVSLECLDLQPTWKAHSREILMRLIYDYEK